MSHDGFIPPRQHGPTREVALLHLHLLVIMKEHTKHLLASLKDFPGGKCVAPCRRLNIYSSCLGWNPVDSKWLSRHKAPEQWHALSTPGRGDSVFKDGWTPHGSPVDTMAFPESHFLPSLYLLIYLKIQKKAIHGAFQTSKRYICQFVLSAEWVKRTKPKYYSCSKPHKKSNLIVVPRFHLKWTFSLN